MAVEVADMSGSWQGSGLLQGGKRERATHGLFRQWQNKGQKKEFSCHSPGAESSDAGNNLHLLTTSDSREVLPKYCVHQGYK